MEQSWVSESLGLSKSLPDHLLSNYLPRSNYSVRIVYPCSWIRLWRLVVPPNHETVNSQWYLLSATAFEICGMVLTLAAMFSVAAFYLHKILYFDGKLDKARNISAFAALTVFSFGRPRLRLL